MYDTNEIFKLEPAVKPINLEETDDLIDRVTSAIRRLHQTDDLLGEIIATLEINLNNGILDDRLRPHVDRWTTTLDQIRALDG
jgi:hypothetical protein